MTCHSVYEPIDVLRVAAMGLLVCSLSCGAAADVGRFATTGALNELADAGPPLVAKLGHDMLVGAVQGLGDSNADAGSALARAMGQSLGSGAVSAASGALPGLLTALSPAAVVAASAAASSAVAGASPGVERAMNRVALSTLSSVRRTERGAVVDLVDAGATLEDHGRQDALEVVSAADAMLTRQRVAWEASALRIVVVTQQSSQKVEWTAGGVLLWVALGVSACVGVVSLVLHWKAGGSMAVGTPAKEKNG